MTRRLESILLLLASSAAACSPTSGPEQEAPIANTGGRDAVSDDGVADDALADGEVEPLSGLGVRSRLVAGDFEAVPEGGAPADVAEPEVSDPGPDEAVAVDEDGDGLADAREAELAAAYLPFLSVSSDDECPASAIVYRSRPHPDDARKVHIVYDVLYADDCGSGGHPGDNEVFAITIDPERAAPAGILAMVAIAHQGTLCDAETRCQTCGPDGNTCSTVTHDGADWPVVFVSRDKHGNYLQDGVGFGRCDGACFFADHCDQAETAARPPMLNAGEPGHPLTRDLTDAGLVTPDNGFADELLHVDPWGEAEFGDAGVISEDLVDSSFDVPVPSC